MEACSFVAFLCRITIDDASVARRQLLRGGGEGFYSSSVLVKLLILGSILWEFH